MASNLRRCIQLRKLVALGQQPQSILSENGFRALATESVRPVVVSGSRSQYPAHQADFTCDQRRSAASHAKGKPAPKAKSQKPVGKINIKKPFAAGAQKPVTPVASQGTATPPPGSSESSAAEGATESASEGVGEGTEEGSAAGVGGDSGTSGESASSQQPPGGEGTGEGASAGFTAEDAKQRAEEAKLKAISWAEGAQKLLKAVREEVTAVLLPQKETTSATKRRAEGAAPADQGTGPSQVMVVEQPLSPFQKGWARLRELYGENPIFKRVEAMSSGLNDNAALRKSREMREDLKERWETSDSPLVHRIQDMSDSMFAETEMARAFKEVLMRDPAFDMVTFLGRLRADVPTIVGAYLNGKSDVLAEHCAPQMVEQLTAIIRAQQTQGLFADASLLDVSEVELADLKFLETDPVIVVQFNCQQINCTRDKFGNVIEGSPDDLQRVYYYWAIQQDASGIVGADGKHYPPRWQLREMLVRGMHALIG